MSLVRDIVDRLFFPDRDVHAIPVLDGGYAPNQRLEEADLIAALPEPAALTQGDDGTLFVATGRTILACEGERFDARRVFTDCTAAVGGLAWSDGTLFACVAGRGVLALDCTGRTVAELTEAASVPLRCPLAVETAADGTVLVTDGSRHNDPAHWLQDLMQCRPASGRLIAWRPGHEEASVLVDGLSWPAGVALAPDEREVFVSESWTHRLLAVARDGGNQRVLVRNFAGYPGSLSRNPAGDYWISFFALRSQLTEFVLREPGFRTRMMQMVSPELWIGPTLGGRADVREPTQIGRIKKLGIQKPWAPARSYGLVARIDATGYALESLHSRSAGTVHGVSGAVQSGERLVVVSRGHGKLVVAPLERG